MKNNHNDNRLPTISIVIVTHNRQFFVELAIQSVLESSPKGISYEIVIVDNSSRDDTRQVVKEYQKKFKHIRYVLIKRISIAYARNIGWRKAKGRYVAFIDSDAFVESSYFTEFTSFIKRHPDVKIFGGSYKRYSEIRIPGWIPDELGSLDLGRKERIIHLGKEWITGTNMVFTKQILKSSGGFDEHLKSQKNDFIYGEDTRLLVALSKRGEKIWYVPGIKVKHFLAKEKINLIHLFHESFRMGKTIVYVHHRKDTLLYHGASLIQKLSICIYFLLVPKKIPIKRRLYYGLRGLCSWAGAFGVYLGLIHGIVHKKTLNK